MKIPFFGDGPGPRTRIISASILRSTFERRAVVIGAVQGGIGVLLALRLGYLAIAENEKYRLESESNRVNLTLIPPRRGWILDRDGAPLASNRADFRVDLIPERLEDPEGTIDRLGALLALEPSRIADIKDKVAGARGFQPVEVASGLRYEQFARPERAPARVSRGRPPARLFALLPHRILGRASGRLCRPRLGRGI